MTDDAKLTASDPEPPVGSRVIDGRGMLWERQPEGYWLHDYGDRDSDPESWVRVCEFGPVHLAQGEMCAADVLTVLNGLEPVDLSTWTFCVLTDAPDGNFHPFERGEILVLDEHRREVGGGRRPAKVDVAEEDFGTLAEALACRERVLAGTWPRSYA